MDSAINVLVNTEIDMPLAECVAIEAVASDCFKTYQLREYIIPPLFIIESLYDQYALRYIYGLHCISADTFPGSLQKCTREQINLAEEYRQEGIRVLNHYA